MQNQNNPAVPGKIFRRFQAKRRNNTPMCPKENDAWDQGNDMPYSYGNADDNDNAVYPLFLERGERRKNGKPDL